MKKFGFATQSRQTAIFDLESRRKACEDTIERSPDIAASVAAANGNGLESTFISAQLPPLDKSSPNFPGLTRQPIQTCNSDAFALARSLDSIALKSDSTSTVKQGKIGVLNLASDREPGGGWRYSLAKTQEEALCYSSTLYVTLKMEWYPWPNTGPQSCAGIISPNVVVFKDTLDNNLVDLPIEQRQVVAVMTVAAPCWPPLSADKESFADDSTLFELRERILLTLRMAANYGVTKLVLGAMGCGAYRCPPRLVAREMKAALEMDEFTGWFDIVVFAVYAAGPVGKRNFDVFTEVFNGV